MRKEGLWFVVQGSGFMVEELPGQRRRSSWVRNPCALVRPAAANRGVDKLTFTATASRRDLP